MKVIGRLEFELASADVIFQHVDYNWSKLSDWFDRWFFYSLLLLHTSFNWWPPLESKWQQVSLILQNSSSYSSSSVVCPVSVIFPIPSFSTLYFFVCFIFFAIVPRAPNMICITVAFILHNIFCPLARSWYVFTQQARCYTRSVFLSGVQLVWIHSLPFPRLVA